MGTRCTLRARRERLRAVADSGCFLAGRDIRSRIALQRVVRAASSATPTVAEHPTEGFVDRGDLVAPDHRPVQERASSTRAPGSEQRDPHAAVLAVLRDHEDRFSAVAADVGEPVAVGLTMAAICAMMTSRWFIIPMAPKSALVPNGAGAHAFRRHAALVRRARELLALGAWMVGRRDGGAGQSEGRIGPPFASAVMRAISTARKRPGDRVPPRIFETVEGPQASFSDRS